MEIGSDSRMALMPSAESPLEEQADGSWHWEHRSGEITIPKSGSFSGSLGVVVNGDVEGRGSVEFQLHFEADGKQTPLIHRRENLAQFETWDAWAPVYSDLAEHGGQTGKFRFDVTVRPRGGAALSPDAIRPVWANPQVLAAPEAPETRPNVLLICLDTLRADHLGAYGYHRDTSPNIDAFARDTVRFEYAIAPSSWTLPSHASLFSGLQPDEHGAVYKLGVIPPGVEMLAEVARRYGYETGALTENGYVSARHGFAQGYESYVSELHVDAAATFDRARVWLSQRRADPFFLFVHTYQIHAPYDPPEAYAERFITSDDANAVRRFMPAYDNTVFDLSEPERRHAEDLYDGEIAYTDDLLGAFLRDFRRSGHWDNTLIMLFSDHGEEFWEHDGYGHAITLYEESIRVPLIVKPAGVASRPGVVDTPVSLTDIYATVADCMGWVADPRKYSYSFRSLLDAGSTPQYARDFIGSVVSIRTRYGFPIQKDDPQRRAYRTDRWKFIQDFTKSPNRKLYHLQHDPAEQRNLLESEAEEIERLLKALRDYTTRVVESGEQIQSGGAPEFKMTKEEEEALAAIGYN